MLFVDVVVTRTYGQEMKTAYLRRPYAAEHDNVFVETFILSDLMRWPCYARPQKHAATSTNHTC